MLDWTNGAGDGTCGIKNYWCLQPDWILSQLYRLEARVLNNLDCAGRGDTWTISLCLLLHLARLLNWLRFSFYNLPETSCMLIVLLEYNTRSQSRHSSCSWFLLGYQRMLHEVGVWLLARVCTVLAGFFFVLIFQVDSRQQMLRHFFVCSRKVDETCGFWWKMLLWDLFKSVDLPSNVWWEIVATLKGFYFLIIGGDIVYFSIQLGVSKPTWYLLRMLCILQYDLKVFWTG